MQRQRVSFWEQQSQLQRHARATLSREEQRGRERGRGSEKASTCVSAVVISSAPSSLLLTRVLKCYRGRCLVRHGDREGKRERKRVLRTAAEWGSVYRDSLCGCPSVCTRIFIVLLFTGFMIIAPQFSFTCVVHRLPYFPLPRPPSQGTSSWTCLGFHMTF